MRTIGGHPRLIEFTDALLRGGQPASATSMPNCATWPVSRKSTWPATSR